MKEQTKESEQKCFLPGLLFFYAKRRNTMRLNPKEQEKLMLHMAGNLAKERRARGLKLNSPGSTRLHQFRASGTSKGRKDRCGADAARHKDSNPATMSWTALPI